MFIVWNYDHRFGRITSVDILDTDDFMVETYSIDDALKIQKSGIHIFGLNADGNFGLVWANSYRLLLIAESNYTFTFKVSMRIRNQLLSDTLVICKSDMYKILDIVKEKTGNKYISIYKVDYDFIRLLDTAIKNFKLVNAKHKLLNGHTCKIPKYASEYSLDWFFRDISHYYFSRSLHSSDVLVSRSGLLLGLNDQLVSQFESYGCELEKLDTSYYLATIKFKPADCKFISKIKY